MGRLSKQGSVNNDFEGEFQELRQLSDSIIDIAHVMIVVLDREGRIVRFNSTAEKITGYSESEVLGKPIWDVLITKEDRKWFKQGIRALDHTDPPTQVENYIRTKNGSLRLLIWSGRAIRNQAGKVKWVIGTGVDVTEQRALQDQLQKTDKMRAMGELAAGIAHDFNNILTGILGHVHLLQLKLKKGITAQEDLSKTLLKIEKSISKASELVGQILKFVKGAPSKMEEVSLNQAVKEVIQVVEPMVKKEGVTIIQELGQEGPVVTGDPGQIQQVILNLLVNGVHACAPGGRVWVRTSTQDCHLGPIGSCAVIEVEDNGIGISSRLRDRIFEPYFTTKDQTKEGTGLGLFVVYNIVKGYKGKIKVWSRLGIGSRFTVLLPLTRCEHEKKIPRDKEHEKQVGALRAPLTVMAIDDDDMLRELFIEGLALLGHKALTASSGYEAIEIFKKYSNDIDLIILDRFMPDISSEELLKNLRQVDPQAKVIFMSGYLPDVEELKRLPGVIGVLHKPFSIYDLKILLNREVAN